MILFLFLFRMVLCRSPILGRIADVAIGMLFRRQGMASARFSSRNGRQPPQNIACFLNSTAPQVPETDLGIMSTPEPFFFREVASGSGWGACTTEIADVVPTANDTGSLNSRNRAPLPWAPRAGTSTAPKVVNL